MTDRRGNDLSYGHFGEAVYDAEEQSWVFSRNVDSGPSFQPIEDLRQCIPPSLQAEPPAVSGQERARIHRSQQRWLKKTIPEAQAGSRVIAALSYPETVQLSTSTLFAVGRANYVDKRAASRAFPVLAMVCGEGRNELRIMKPQIDSLSWDTNRSVWLRVLNPAQSEAGFWIGDRSPIEQIVYAHDIEGPTPWLAVRNATSTTFLKPVYQRNPVPCYAPQGFVHGHHMSRIDANPIVSLSLAASGGQKHADVSFNPWYIKQFAIVDITGRWSIWDIQGKDRANVRVRTPRMSRSKSGILRERPGNENDLHGNGWARIVWAGDLNTIVVCDRVFLQVFHTQGQPRHLLTEQVVKANSGDWIIDMRRSPVNPRHVFILTSTRIFWILITPAASGEADTRQGTAKVLLSCKHFRNSQDDTMRLETIRHDDACTVLLYSQTSSYVLRYAFSTADGSSEAPTCRTESFYLKAEAQIDGGEVSVRCLAVLPVSFIQHEKLEISGPGASYVEQESQFYQLLTLGSRFELHQALAVCSESSRLEFKVPRTRRAQRSVALSGVTIEEDDFVVSDDMLDDIDPGRDGSRVGRVSNKWSRAQRNRTTTIDASSLHRMAFTASPRQSNTGTIEAAIQRMAQAIQERVKNELPGTETLLQLSQISGFEDDIDLASTAIHRLIKQLQDWNTDHDGYFGFSISSIDVLAELGVDENVARGTPTLSTIYDKLVEIWISSLPASVPGVARLEKEKRIRAIAVELYLSSLIGTIRQKPEEALEESRKFEKADMSTLSLPFRGRPGDPLQTQSQRHITSEPSRSLPTPDPTPSIASRDGSVASTAFEEDPSIAQLRDYGVTMERPPPPGEAVSRILDHWPSTPGSDPTAYSWSAVEAMRAEHEEGSDEEASEVRRKERERRKKRTEKFLKRQRENTVGSANQPVIATSIPGSRHVVPMAFTGSQPEMGRVSSPAMGSQELPMTQPSVGVFGSRILDPGQKRGAKKRRIKGF